MKYTLPSAMNFIHQWTLSVSGLRSGHMSDRVFKRNERVDSSLESTRGAIQGAVKKASKTVHDMRWFGVVKTSDRNEDG